ncbi:MAG: hypothetical protein WKF50_14655 [Nocardioides sp.]
MTPTEYELTVASHAAGRVLCAEIDGSVPWEDLEPLARNSYLESVLPIVNAALLALPDRADSTLTRVATYVIERDMWCHHDGCPVTRCTCGLDPLLDDLATRAGKAGVSDAETPAAEPGQSVVEPADKVTHPGTHHPIVAALTRIARDHAEAEHADGAAQAGPRLVRRGTCTCGEVSPENAWGHADGCRYFSDSVYAPPTPDAGYAAGVAAAREVVDAALVEIDEDCAHEPDEHAEGTCELCDFAFASSATVRAALDALTTEGDRG